MREHTWYECNCNDPCCMFCAGGLGSCTVCGGFEGTLTSECTGKKLQESTRNAVWKHYIDFKDGRWITGRLWWDGKIHNWDEYRKRYEHKESLYESFLDGRNEFSQKEWQLLIEFGKQKLEDAENKKAKGKRNEQKTDCRTPEIEIQ